MRREIIERITLDIDKDKGVLEQIKSSNEWELVAATYPKDRVIYERVKPKSIREYLKEHDDIFIPMLLLLFGIADIVAVIIFS